MTEDHLDPEMSGESEEEDYSQGASSSQDHDDDSLQSDSWSDL